MKATTVLSAAGRIGLAATLAVLCVGTSGFGRYTGYPANPCTADDARFQSVHGGCYDSQTGLVWGMNAGNPQRAGGVWDYPGATNYASNLEEGNYGDWRLPTADELRAVKGVPAQTHLNVFYNSNGNGGAGGYVDFGMWSTTGGKKGPCPTNTIVQLGAGTEANWGIKAWPKPCSSATDFVCVRVHQASDPN